MPDSFEPTLLQILVCPLTRTALRYDQEIEELISGEAGLAYSVRGGVPVMLVEEARHLLVSPKKDPTHRPPVV